MPPQRQLIEPVEQHCQTLGAAEDVEERIEPRLFGVLAEEALADRVPAADPELLEGPLQQRLAAFAQSGGGGLAGGDREDALGPGPGGDEVGEAVGEELGLAGAGRADDQQRPLAVGNRALALRSNALSHRQVLAHHPKLAPGRCSLASARWTSSPPTGRRSAAASLPPSARSSRRRGRARSGPSTRGSARAATAPS